MNIPENITCLVSVYVGFASNFMLPFRSNYREWFRNVGRFDGPSEVGTRLTTRQLTAAPI